MKENEIAGESHLLREGVPCKCYDFWEKNKTCNHCISTDTFKTKKDYAKIEFCNDSCFGNPQLLVEKSYRELLANKL